MLYQTYKGEFANGGVMCPAGWYQPVFHLLHNRLLETCFT